MQTIEFVITDTEEKAYNALSLAKKKPADFIREALDMYLAETDLPFEEALTLTQGICAQPLSFNKQEWEERNKQFV